MLSPCSRVAYTFICKMYHNVMAVANIILCKICNSATNGQRGNDREHFGIYTQNGIKSARLFNKNARLSEAKACVIMMLSTILYLYFLFLKCG
jgi:hypothetical protein